LPDRSGYFLETFAGPGSFLRFIILGSRPGDNHREHLASAVCGSGTLIWKPRIGMMGTAMILLILQFIMIASVIVVAGTYLTYYADRVGDVLGWGRSLAGLVLLAAATSLPELAVNCRAAVIDAPDLAVGNALGSSLLNLLILALLDLGYRSHRRILSPVAAAHALSATASVVLTAIAILFMIFPFMKLPPLSWQGIGLGSVAITVSYFLFLRLIFFDLQYAASVVSGPEGKGEAAKEVSDSAAPGTPVSPAGRGPWQKLFFGRPKGAAEVEARSQLQVAARGYLVATAIVFVAAYYLAPTADQLAEKSGLGGTFVGTTFVALCTSLPELVTTLAAVRMGALEMAVGNIFGSNAFNMAILFPVDALYRRGPLLASVEPAHLVSATAVIIVTSVATVGLLYRVERPRGRVDLHSVLMLLLVAGTLGLIYCLGPSGA
jgi:cation:H+ antiporter